MSDDKMSHSGLMWAWWNDNIADRNDGAARALSARLRRAGPIEALSEPAVFRLAQSLGTRDPVRIHRIVSVLANIRSNRPLRIAQAFGAGDPPALSPLRFQRVLRADGEALGPALIRVLPMIDRSCNVGTLGADLFFWNDATRTRWIFDYHGATQPGPTESEETSE